MSSRNRSVGAAVAAAAGGACDHGRHTRKGDSRGRRIRLAGAVSTVTMMDLFSLIVIIVVASITTVTTTANTDGGTTGGPSMKAVTNTHYAMSDNMNVSAGSVGKVTVEHTRFGRRPRF